MKLFEIDEKIASCITLPSGTIVDTETGEVIDVEALNALEMEREKKIENIACWYKNLLSDAEALKAQKNIFAERERVAKNKAESLKKFLSEYLQGNKFETEKVALSFRKSEAVEFTGKISEVPEEYLKYKEPEIDKAAIKKALKAGEQITGCELVTKSNLQIK